MLIHHPRPLGAFSLLELLVVISIIALLASMLLPAIGMVRRAARATSCQSNQHQIYLGIAMYSHDWDGEVMSAAIGSPSISTWGQILATELNIPTGWPLPRTQFRVFNCPENTAQYTAMGSGGSDGETSYQGNGWTPNQATWDGLFFSSRLPLIQHASEVYAFWDGAYYRTEIWNDDGGGTVPATTLGVRMLRYRHQGKANLMFADGHADKSQMMRSRGSFLGGSGDDAASFSNGQPFYGR